ncbi:MAG: fasciclin domain-containing protein [Actinomycetota bacterium]
MLGEVVMENEDTGFFILVLGVLAAVVTVVAWWAVQDDPGPTPLFASSEIRTAEEAESLVAGPDASDASGEPHDPPTEDSVEVELVEPDQADTLDSADSVDAADTADEADIAAEEDPGDEQDPAESSGDGVQSSATTPLPVLEVLASDPELTIVAGLIGAAGLNDELAGDGPFTILAPSNATIESFDPDAAGELFGADRAANVLAYHVIPGRYSAADLTAVLRGARRGEIETLHGDPIALSLDDGRLVLNDTVTVRATDADAGNGIVHTVDGILVPREAALNLIVRLEPIQFASGSAVIAPESTATLDRVAEALTASDIGVIVGGHTDDDGDAIFNNALSLERARAVVNYLVVQGVAEPRLSAEGFGASQPVADNDTDEGRALNRRIEFVVEE